MEPKIRGYILNFAIAQVPDLLVCWVAMRLTDNEWSSFWLALGALWAIYFFLWLKQAVWSWLMFWTVRKRKMAEFLENSFIEDQFPTPVDFPTDIDEYLGGIAHNVKLDASTRVKAAGQIGELEGLKAGGRFSMVLQTPPCARRTRRRDAQPAQPSPPERDQRSATTDGKKPLSAHRRNTAGSDTGPHRCPIERFIGQFVGELGGSHSCFQQFGRVSRNLVHCISPFRWVETSLTARDAGHSAPCARRTRRRDAQPAQPSPPERDQRSATGTAREKKHNITYPCRRRSNAAVFSRIGHPPPALYFGQPGTPPDG